MGTVLTSPSTSRTVRLTTLVNESEGERVAKRATAAGLSVSAYLRERALGDGDNAEEQAAGHQVDALIQQMEADLDSAISALSGTLARISGT